MDSKRMHVNPRIIEHLGSELITSSAVAVVELIKNSLDAKSKEVKVQLFDNLKKIDESSSFLTKINNKVISIFPDNTEGLPILVIEDIGLGMDENTLEEGFLNIGTDIKKKKKSPNDAFLGEKGIGRLAAQRLGNILIVETASTSEKYCNVVVIEWDKLSSTKDIDSIELPYYQFEKEAESYTRLWIFNVQREDIIELPEQLSLFQNTEVILSNELSETVCFLISPFSNKTGTPTIEFWNNNKLIKYGFNNDFLNFAESVHTFNFREENNELVLDLELEIKPWFIEKTHRACIKPSSHFRLYEKTFQEYLDLFNKHKERYDLTLKRTVPLDGLILKFKELRKRAFKNVKDSEALDEYLASIVKSDIEKLKTIAPIEGKAYTFKQDYTIGNMYIKFSQYLNQGQIKSLNDYEFPDLKKFLSQFSGVKLYRNNYRIGSLGNKADDWIQMQQYRTVGQQFYRFIQGNTIGYVSLNDPNQENIREISSRLNIYENDVAKVFKEFIIIVFNHYFFDFNRAADFITKSILNDEGLIPNDTKKNVEKNLETNKALIEQNKKLLEEIRKTKKLLSKKVEISGENVNLSISSYNKAIETLNATDSQIQASQDHFDKTQKILDEAREGLKAIEIEAFNNYKLMANGLITETITHELHSVISDEYSANMEIHFGKIKEYLYDTNVKMYGQHLLPIKDKTDLLLDSINNITNLYKFLEKTFIKNNSFDEYSTENVEEIVKSIEKKLLKDIKKKNIDIRGENLSQQWYMPKGVLLHVLYNLFTNSIYWIDIRKKRALTDEMYKSTTRDEIVIEQPTPDNIIIYDTGIGVIQRMEYTLFDPLQSGKESEGRGMGLYIVKKLLNSFQGDIELLEDRNKYGNRYIFSITVPEDCMR